MIRKWKHETRLQPFGEWMSWGVLTYDPDEQVTCPVCQQDAFPVLYEDNIFRYTHPGRRFPCRLPHARTFPPPSDSYDRYTEITE